MLKFQRTKLVDVVNLDDEELRIHGVLDDHIFGLEIDVVITLDTLVIRSITGQWNRQETPECPRAIPFLQEAVGVAIVDDAFSQKINKTVGRHACPHFANLLIECCDAAREAARTLQWERARAADPELSFEQFLAGNQAAVHAAKPRPAETTVIENPAPTGSPAAPRVNTAGGQGFVIDLHMHSFPASSCSTVGVDELIVEARRIGLNAICLTDHNHVWDPNKISELTQKHGFPVFSANEITTDQGDMLVFGLAQDVRGIISLPELRRLVDDCQGYMIAAHPFRGFLVFDASQIGMTVQKAVERPVYKLVDAIEVLNGKVTAKENRFAGDVAAHLGLPGTGGSDAHEIESVGKYATRFQAAIRSHKDLLAALHSGNYTPVAFR